MPSKERPGSPFGEAKAKIDAMHSSGDISRIIYPTSRKKRIMSDSMAKLESFSVQTRLRGY